MQDKSLERSNQNLKVEPLKKLKPEIAENPEEALNSSRSGQENDRLLDEVPASDERENTTESKNKSGFFQPLQQLKSSKPNESDLVEIQFWKKSKSWKKRKQIAEKHLMAQKETLNQGLHLLAFQGKYEKFENLEESKKNFQEDNQENKSEKVSHEERMAIDEKLLQKDSLGLTPLIYAIWGEENRNDAEKKTSKLIFQRIHELYRIRLGWDADRILTSTKVPFDPILKNELGHALVHDIIKDKIGIYNLICEDLDEAVSYFIETNGFSLIREQFIHPVIQENDTISIVAFALRVKSIKCVQYLLNHVMKSIETPQFSNMILIIEGEISDYLSFNSPIIQELITCFTNVQEKSFVVNKYKIPQFRMVDCHPGIVANFAYNTFNNMPDAEDFFKCQIINSKIKFPALNGSSDSLRIMQALASTENKSLFRLVLIKSYLQYKWESLKILIIFQSILMWANIPLMVLLIFVHKFNFGLLIAFAVINGLLTVLEFLQFTSMGLFQYLGNVNQRSACLGLRMVLLALIFIPNFQPYSCTIYLCISGLFVVGKAYVKLQLLALLLFIGGFLCIFFPAFWVEWDNVGYLMIGIGTLLLCYFTYYGKKNKSEFQNYLIRCLELAMLLVVIFMTKKNFGILIITQFMTGVVFFNQLFMGAIRFFWCKLLLDFFTIVIFSINFYTEGTISYYIINSLALFLSILKNLIAISTLGDLVKNIGAKEDIFTIYTLFSALLIGFDLEDSNPFKIFIIIVEFAFMMLYCDIGIVSLSEILKNLISLIFCWNTIDLAKIVFCIIWLISQFNRTTDLAITYTLAVLILLRGLTAFRCFKMTRYYVRLILNSINDILPFILIFFYSTLSFGIICSIYRDISMSEIWMYPYDLNIGASSHDDTFDMNYISFFIATVINVLIMLNLLISILGDSFEKFQIIAVEIDYLEIAQTVLEFENMLFWRRRTFDLHKNIIAILNESTEKKIKEKITREEFFELSDSVGSLKESMEKQYELIENRIINKITTCLDEKEERILKILKSNEQLMEKRNLETESRIISLLEKFKK